MRGINRPSGLDFANTRRIIEAKQGNRRTVLRALAGRLYEAYRGYQREAPAFERLNALTLSSEEKEALAHAYEVDTVPLKVMRQSLMSPLDVSTCPYCGIGDSTTLDHYLPQEKFIEYAIFAKNLVPCCVSCNQAKSAKFLDASGQRMFIHPYFEDTSSVQLAARVIMRKSAMLLSFFLEPATAAPVSALVETHFREFGLADRYRVRSLSHLRKHRASFIRYYGSKADAKLVSDELRGRADALEISSGKNYWESVLYRALADCDKFCDGGFVVLNRIQ